MPPSRVESLEDRIRDSGRFPRIDEAMAKIAVVKAAKEKARTGGKGKPKKTKGQILVEEAKADIAAQMAGPTKGFKYFNTFQVNDNPEISKDLLYDEVVYPKLFNEDEEIPADSIERLWMAGFLDRAVRDQKELEHLPPPKFLTERDAGIRRREKEAAAKEKKKKAKGVKELIQEAINKRRPSQLDDVESDEEDGKKVLAQKPKRRKPKSKAAKAAAHDPAAIGDALDVLESPRGGAAVAPPPPAGAPVEGAVVISAAEEERLKRLENVALGLNEDGSDPMKSGAAIKMLRAQGIKAPAFQKKKLTKAEKLKKSVDAKVSIYTNEAKRIKALLKPVSKPDPEAEFYSKELEYIFEVERVENEAALRIQRAWRDATKLYPLRHAVYAMLQARTIQKMVRGMVTRKWLAPWFIKREYLTIRWQASFRRWRSNKYWGMQETLERESVTLLQRRWRGWLGRNRHREKKWSIACIAIQALWRGVVARARADKKWLHNTVIPIQVVARKMIAKRKVADMSGDLDKAALKIQMRFRMYRAKIKMGKALYAREMLYREDVITMIVAEEEWCAEQLVKMAGRMGRNTLKPELEHAANQMHDKFDEIYLLENDLMETSRQREILSPRAISQGWVVELDKKIVSLRDQITNYKLDTLFHKCLKVNILEHQLESKVVEIEEMAARRHKWAYFRQQENADRVARDYVSNVGNMRKEHRQKVADEMRKWRVLYTTSDGKPDKRRRPGRPWDESVLAQPNRQTLNPQVDLLAEIKAENEIFKPGTDESVDQSLRRAALQRYLDQVNTYEQLLNPLAEIMQMNLGGAPRGGRAPEDTGFGPVMGPLLPTALADVGATPAAWGNSTQAKQQKTAKMVEVLRERGHNDSEILKTIKQLGMEVPPGLPLSPLSQAGSPAHRDQLHLGFSDSFDMTQVGSSGVPRFSTDELIQGSSRPQSLCPDDGSVSARSGLSFASTQYSASYTAGVDGMSRITGSVGLDEAASVGLASIESEFERANRIAEEQYQAKKAAQRHARRMERRPKPVSIPWKLLDELDAEKRKFQKENALRELTEETLRRKKEEKFLPHLAAKRRARGGG